MQIEWQRLNEEGILWQEGGQMTHLLIDQGRWLDIQKFLYECLEQPEFALLFATTHHQPLLDASPLLVLLPADESAREQLISETSQRFAGVGLRSDLSLVELATHFRAFLTVPDGAGESYLRFYDPAILAALWLSKMCSALGRGVDQWWLPDWGKAGWRVFSSSTTGNDMAPRITPELEEHAMFVRLLYLLPPQSFVHHAWLALCTMQVIKGGLTEHWEWYPWCQALARQLDNLPAIWPGLTGDLVSRSDPDEALAELLNEPLVIEKAVC
ncbi:DUF4123 domain-containing protein [Aeromonas enteropelogenes]|uniref:DUF4123 domain-containing protein n=1 Tax=Aeromonas TaxID=642 RepID=UPI00191DE7D9|nr:DUF4123 domain-containing protein [Aeromonas enteropelogenes]MBL0458439.1 DUF4123 domain-containing protein [Aeromonas enteropelogenes]